MKKFIIKSVSFIVIFALAFLAIQSVLRYHWPGDEYTKYVDYAKNNPDDTIDVFVFGTSEMMNGYSPATTYFQQGITGYNFAMQNRSAMSTYYQFLYALKHQTPKVVVCDFMSLFDTAYPSESETIYRRAVDTMPDWQIRNKLIEEICRVDETQDRLSWYCPVFRYHTVWNELEPTNFTSVRSFDRNYPDYKKGCTLAAEPIDPDKPYDIVPSLWDTTEPPLEPAEFSTYYYDKMIEECKARGIKVVCVMTPKVSDAAVIAQNWPKMTEYFDSRGVDYLNYCTYEQIDRMHLSLYHDYFDTAHLNTKGAIAFSAYVADDLRELYPDLPDRRNDPSCSAAWNQAWQNLANYYAEISEE